MDEVLLEGAPIRRLAVNDDRISLVLDAALLGGHPDYHPPPRGEMHCRAELLIQIRGSVEGDPARVGSVLVTLEVGADRLVLVGDEGRLVVRDGSVRVRRAR